MTILTKKIKVYNTKSIGVEEKWTSLTEDLNRLNY